MSKLHFVLLTVFLLTIPSADFFGMLDRSFTCKKSSGNYSIKEYLVCDLYPDCADGEDEDMEMCLSRICRHGDFRCNSGQCISGIGHCYLRADCKDGSQMSKEICNQKFPINSLPKIIEMGNQILP